MAETCQIGCHRLPPVATDFHGKECHEEGPSRGTMLRASLVDEGRPVAMLYAGLDLSRKRLDFHLLDPGGATVEIGAAPPDADGLHALTRRLDGHCEPIRAAIESMNGARFV